MPPPNSGSDLNMVPLPDGMQNPLTLPDSAPHIQELCKRVSASDSGLELLPINMSGALLSLKLRLRGSENTFVLELVCDSNGSINAKLRHPSDPRCSTTIDCYDVETSDGAPSGDFNTTQVMSQVRESMTLFDTQCKRPYDQSICRWYGAKTTVGCAICNRFRMCASKSEGAGVCDLVV